MPIDRFKAAKNGERVQREARLDPHFRHRQDAALRYQVKAEKKALVPRQSVEEFLADGGTIKQVEVGVEGTGKLSARGRQRFGRKTMNRFGNKK